MFEHPNKCVDDADDDDADELETMVAQWRHYFYKMPSHYLYRVRRVYIYWIAIDDDKKEFFSIFLLAFANVMHEPIYV